MNKTLIFIFLPVLIFMFSCKSETESNNSNDSSKNSSDIKDDFNKEYLMPKVLDYEQKKESLIFDGFYPIGWSKDGKFAYIVEPVDEGSGFYFFKFMIVDFNNAQVVWKWEINESDKIETGNIAEIWEKHNSKFSEELRKNKIIQSDTHRIDTFPINILGKQYDYKQELKFSKDDIGFGFDIVAFAKNYLIIDKTQKLIISQQDYQDDIILKHKASGLIQSPDSKYLGVIISSERWGYEGPPNVVNFDIVGYKIVN